MEYITSSDFHFKNTAVALGKFEGIHRGHQLLMDEVKKQELYGLQSVVFTFDRPTRLTLTGDTKYKQIYTKEERKTILETRGLNILIEHPFTKEFAALTPERFIREVLVEKVGAKVIVVGTDFHFGKNRSGSILDLENLEEECGYHLIVVEKLQLDGKDISSTRIPDAEGATDYVEVQFKNTRKGYYLNNNKIPLEKGDMEEASALLGRNYSVSGEIIHGNALGRTIQVPTINQKVPSFKLLPPNGVYVSKIHWNDEVYYGITNIGTKPTVNDTSEKTVETNIFDFDKDVYGEKMVVELLHYHRKESRFSSVEALQTQLFKDIEFGKQFVAKIR